MTGNNQQTTDVLPTVQPPSQQIVQSIPPLISSDPLRLLILTLFLPLTMYTINRYSRSLREHINIWKSPILLSHSVNLVTGLYLSFHMIIPWMGELSVSTLVSSVCISLSCLLVSMYSLSILSICCMYYTHCKDRHRRHGMNTAKIQTRMEKSMVFSALITLLGICGSVHCLLPYPLLFSLLELWMYSRKNLYMVEFQYSLSVSLSNAALIITITHPLEVLTLSTLLTWYILPLLLYVCIVCILYILFGQTFRDINYDLIHKQHILGLMRDNDQGSGLAVLLAQISGHADMQSYYDQLIVDINREEKDIVHSRIKNIHGQGLISMLSKDRKSVV